MKLTDPIADAPPQPQGPQPSFPPLNGDTFDHFVAELVLPLYREGTRRQWGSHAGLTCACPVPSACA